MIIEGAFCGPEKVQLFENVEVHYNFYALHLVLDVREWHGGICHPK